ncbi:MAG: AAA family ATPase [Patescibacteria group bacterium]
MSENNVPMVVLTGGPDAGKTTILSFLRQKLEELGWTVFFVPETATLMINGGLRPRGVGSNPKEFQLGLLKCLLALEDAFCNMAKIAQSNGERVVVICDRGAMDGQAYLEKTLFENLVKSLGRSTGEFLGQRYQGIIHLQSTAVGLPEMYNHDNPARTETVEEAMVKDQAVLEAWCGHQHIKIITADENFAKKRQAVLAATCSLLGIPIPLEIERKFLLSRFDPRSIPDHGQWVEIEQRYFSMSVPGEEERIRKRTKDGFVGCFQARKTVVRPGVRSEQEYPITVDEYTRMLDRVDPKARPIVKDRCCFFFRDQYFELDVFGGHLEGLVMLEVELTEEGQAVSLPPSLQIIEEVTADSAYSNRSLAYNGVP